jgi:metal-dependent amidase/aminoacylase/carboxypeptidase family protein
MVKRDCFMTNFGPKNRTQPQLDIVTLRPDFHQNPELGFHEERTGAKVAQYLRALGLDVRSRLLLIGIGGVTALAFFAQIMARRGDV